MIKLAFFDFSKTIAKDTGFGSGPSFMNREKEYNELYGDFTSHKLNEIEFIESVIKLWEGFKEEDLSEIYLQIELNPNVEEVLKQLKDMKIKLALVSFIPLKLAELYRDLGFDHLIGTECEVKDGVFTGKVLKMNPDKGAVAKELSNQLSIGLNECIAIGDSKNDIRMFKATGYDNSFAYNALEEVQKYAKHHITDFKEIIPIIKIGGDIKTIFKKRIEIFEKSWKEFYKDKPTPKTVKEDIEQQKEFAKFLKDKYGLDFEFKE
jgi:HAD superfamily phosphoserine phosphatase-like hydrolase